LPSDVCQTPHGIKIVLSKELYAKNFVRELESPTFPNTVHINGKAYANNGIISLLPEDLSLLRYNYNH